MQLFGASFSKLTGWYDPTRPSLRGEGRWDPCRRQKRGAGRNGAIMNKTATQIIALDPRLLSFLPGVHREPQSSHIPAWAPGTCGKGRRQPFPEALLVSGLTGWEAGSPRCVGQGVGGPLGGGWQILHNKSSVTSADRVIKEMKRQKPVHSANIWVTVFYVQKTLKGAIIKHFFTGKVKIGEVFVNRKL